MTTFLITLAVTFALLLASGLFISYSKRRQRNSRHGLTGMCHETGGEMCGCCSQVVIRPPARGQSSYCDRSPAKPATEKLTRLGNMRASASPVHRTE